MTPDTDAALLDRIDPNPMPLNRTEIRARLATAGNSRLQASGDFDATQRLLDLGGLQPASANIKAFRVVSAPPPVTGMLPAAVLVPLVEYDDGYKVLLTQRTAHLNKHAGQVAFPGGRMDPEDRDAETCALREAWEEIGLDPAKVDILGRLSSWTTGSGFDITPVVGAIAPPLLLNPGPSEVADVFEVPLAFILDSANHRRVSHEVLGVMRAFYEIPYQDRYIWGATAGMLVNLYHALVP